VTPEELRSKLSEVGARRTAAGGAKQKASAELAALIPQAIDAGLGPVEIAQLSGLSRQAIYELTHRRSSSSR
jgi:hypothetical protein